MNHRKKILLMEEDTPVGMYIVHLLTRVNYEVEVVRSGSRGLELAKEVPFDLIILDIDSSEINGFEICRQLKQRHISRRTPVIFLSGHLNVNACIGGVECLAKPFDAEKFILAVATNMAISYPPSDDFYRGTRASAPSLA